MSTLLAKQVKAFGDATTEANEPSMRYWSVRDLAEVGPRLANLIVDIVQENRLKPKAAKDQCDTATDICNAMLQSMTEGRRLIVEQIHSGIDPNTLSDFDDAMFRLRELLASLQNSENTQVVQMSSTVEEFADVAKKLPPQQSWFEEDFAALRGPGH
jgi:hypothetical protein